MSMATPCTADMGEGRGSSPEVLVRLGWWCGGDSVPCRVDVVPCRTAAEKKACFHFVSDDHDGLVASGLMALVMGLAVWPSSSWPLASWTRPCLVTRWLPEAAII